CRPALPDILIRNTMDRFENDMDALHLAVFAHNEEKRILRCLESILGATAHPERLRVKVLINGSRDRTETLVRDFAHHHPQIEPVVILLGDKANAWNTYVYEHAGKAPRHVFIDGDVWLPAGTLDAVEAALQAQEPLAVAPLPIGVSESLREFLRTR